MYIMYLDYLLTILKLSSRSAGDLRSFRTTPRYLVFFSQMLLYSPWLKSYLDLDYFELPTTFQTYIIFLWTGFLSLFQVLGLWEQWNKVSDNKGVSFSLFFIIYTFSTTCRMSWIGYYCMSSLELLLHCNMFFLSIGIQDRGVQLEKNDCC